MRNEFLRGVAVALVGALLFIAAPATPASAACGDFNADGQLNATDGLGVLKAAVGLETCDLVRCDADRSGTVAPSDALLVLRGAVGQAVTLDCPGVAISDIDQLPRATGPVAGGSGLSALVELSAMTTGGAVSGINLAGLGDSTFDSTSSIAACEVSNLTRSAVNAASQADRILCYVQNIFAANDDGTVDIYDGDYHTFGLDFGTPPPGANPDDFGGPTRVKMRIVREGNTIVDFEMFACDVDEAGESQSEYIRQTIDGPDFSMTVTGHHSHGGGLSSEAVTVVGSLNDAGLFVGSKLVDVVHDSQWFDGAGFGELQYVQSADSFSLDGFDSGEFSHDGFSGTFARRIHAQAELLDENGSEGPYDLSLLSIGHGAAKARTSGSDSFGSWDHQATQGWNGDTTEVDSEVAGAFLELVEDAELVAIGNAPSIEFTPEQTYGCDDPIESVVFIDMLELDVACSALDLGYDYVNCYDIIQPHDEGCDGPDCGPCEGPDCGEPCEGPDCGPCEGPDCGPCEGPDCGDDCWDPECDCDPEEDPECFELCWDPECGEPCFGPDCGEPCEGPDCGPCEGPDCGEPCEGPDCGEPCEGPDCGPCEGPDCGEPCEGPDCGPCEGPDCGEPCEGPDCGPCEGPDCGEPCEGPDCEHECWDPECNCDPEDPECFEQCWDPECGEPCFGPECEEGF